MDKWVESQLQIIRNTEVDQQIKLICIIELMYRKDISLYQAYRLLTDIGLLSEDWRYLVQQAVTLSEELYRRKMSKIFYCQDSQKLLNMIRSNMQQEKIS